MADSIKIGSLDISSFKVGSSDCKVYLGDTLLYPQQTVTPKLTAYYSDGSVYQPSCNTSTTLTQSEVRAHTTSYTAMTSVVVGDCVTTIGQNAFRMGNYSPRGSLSSITLSNSVKTISAHAFSYNSALKTFEMPNNVTSLGSNVFYYCTSLSSVTLSQNITGISTALFNECESLKSVVIPSGVTSIGQAAFYSCKNLASLEIPNSVTTIQNRAFASMGQSITSGASITIGSGVTSIGYGAFLEFGTALTAATNVVTIYAATPPSMILSTATTANNRWGFRENTVVYVPCDSVNAYKADEYWGKYASQIEAIPDSCPKVLQWVSYSEGDTVPSTIFYGVKLYTGLDLDGEIDFSVAGNNGVAFIHDTSNDEWTALDMTSYDPIDISEYFDDTEGCYIIYFSDLGYDGMPINYPVPSESFEFDVQLYIYT